MWVKCTEHWGYYGPDGGIFTWEVPGGSWVGFCMESLMQLINRFHDPWYIPPWEVAAFLPDTNHPPVMQLTTQHSGWSEREVGLYGSTPQSWGSGMLTHRFSLTPMEEITGQKVLMALNCVALEEQGCRYSQTAPLISPGYLLLVFFCSNHVM